MNKIEWEKEVNNYLSESASIILEMAKISEEKAKRLLKQSMCIFANVSI